MYTTDRDQNSGSNTKAQDYGHLCGALECEKKNEEKNVLEATQKMFCPSTLLKLEFVDSLVSGALVEMMTRIMMMLGQVKSSDS